jgi:hypothetical protein
MKDDFKTDMIALLVIGSNRLPTQAQSRCLAVFGCSDLVSRIQSHPGR